LFDLFSADCIFGLHNFPDIPLGHFAVKTGAMMAAFDCFEITLSGQATHAAMPHMGNDVFIASAQLINALQTIVSRNVNPADSAVVSITQIHGGNTWNAIPDTVILRGTFRCFSKQVQALIETRIKTISKATADSFNLSVDIAINPENPGYPVTQNSVVETEIAIKAAQDIVGVDKVNLQPIASMGSEDFSFLLNESKGCYVSIGNGASASLHNPYYDFNDEILPTGVSYWVKLVLQQLAE
jgi:hippurate hydrolase